MHYRMKDKIWLWANRIFAAIEAKKDVSDRSREKAISWFRRVVISGEGFPVSTGQNISYPEVTGYIIPTLYEVGEKDFARDLARWLISVQHSEGAFCAPDGMPYTFDTGQVLRGLLTVLDDMPQVKEHTIRACDWILTQIQSDGKITTPSTDMWHLPNDAMINDNIHLYILPPLIEAGKKFGKSEYEDASHRALTYYKQRPDLISFTTLSHFYGYVMEALCVLGEKDLAKQGMEEVAALQKFNGSIPAYPGVDWVCTPGVAQLAIVWYKLGMSDRGDAALRYLKRIQNDSGGFFGSYGRGANYFPRKELPWAAKYFLDACHWSQRKAKILTPESNI